MEGNKLGWARFTVEPTERAGKRYLRVHYRLQMKVTSLGDTRESSVEAETLFDASAPYAVVSGWHEQRQGAFTKRVDLQGRPGR